MLKSQFQFANNPMPEECSDLKIESEKVGDRFYRAMTNWVTSGARSHELNIKASRLARAYYKALNLLLLCLQKLKRTPKVEASIEHAAEFQGLLKQDIELLNARQTPLPPEP